MNREWEWEVFTDRVRGCSPCQTPLVPGPRACKHVFPSRSQCISVHWSRRGADPQHRKGQIHTTRWNPMRLGLVHPSAEVFCLSRARPAVQFTLHHGPMNKSLVPDYPTLSPKAGKVWYGNPSQWAHPVVRAGHALPKRLNPGLRYL